MRRSSGYTRSASRSRAPSSPLLQAFNRVVISAEVPPMDRPFFPTTQKIYQNVAAFAARFRLYGRRESRIGTGNQIKHERRFVMKTPNIYLPMAALILAALAIPMAAQQQVPFKGTFEGIDSVDVTVTPPTITTFGTGIGTLVGQFSLKNVTTVTVGPPLGGTGRGQWIAANGDSIDTEFAATTEPVDMPTCQIVGAQPGDGYLQVTEEHKVTGG